MPDSATNSVGGISRSKLHLPVVRRESVPRPRLEERLELQTTGPGLTLLVAPAGWGKSTLLGSWIANRAAGTVAFLQIDKPDNEPSLFNRYLVAALAPFLGTAETDLMASGAVALNPDLFGSDVAEALWDHRGPITFVIDDLHLVTSDTALSVLTSLLHHAPEKFHLIVGARADPALSVPRLRADGRLSEVRMSDLAFTVEEADRLLNGVMSLELTHSDLETLHSRTEGWPAGTYLAGLSIQRQEDPSTFIGEFTGSSRHIVDYLSDEVLQGLDDAERSFLLETSILEKLSPEVCDSVASRDDSALRLRDIEAANLFLIPLDDNRHEYRYHHLFREWLLSDLHFSDPSRARQLHRAAALYYRKVGDPELAAAHALSSEDTDLFASLVADNWYWALNTGRNLLLATWLDAVPVEVKAQDPWLALGEATALINSGAAHDDVRTALSIVESLAEQVTHERKSKFTTVFALEAAAHLRMAGDHRKALEVLIPAFDADPDPPTTGSLAQMAGSAHFWLGEHDDAEELTRTGVSLCEEHGARLSLELARGVLAANSYVAGDFEIARRLALDAKTKATEDGLYDSPYSAMTRFVEVATGPDPQPVEFDTPLHGSRLARYLPAVAFGLIEKAPTMRRAGDLAGARACLKEAEDIIGGFSDPGFLPSRLASARRALPDIATKAPRHIAIEQVTEKEQLVLRLLSGSLTQREIADELFVSINTVKSHVRSIYSKLSAASRAEAVETARTHGLI